MCTKIINNIHKDTEGKTQKEENLIEYEQQISNDIEEILKNDSFFNLPNKNQISFLSQIDFSLKNINAFSKVIKKMDENQRILLISKLKKEFIQNLSFEDFVSLLSCFNNIHIFVIFSELNKEYITGNYVDYEYKIEQKDKEIKTLKTILKKLKELTNNPKFPPIIKKPKKISLFLCYTIFDAIDAGDFPSVQWFIEKEGVNVDERDKYNNTPLMIASLNSQYYPNESLSVVEYLLEKGADVNTKNDFEETALHLARTLEVAKYLVEYGADIESVTKDGSTPLIYHSQWGREDIVKFLLSVGANKEAENNECLTACDVACNAIYYGDPERKLKKGLQKILQ